MFPLIYELHITKDSSDHLPILFNFDGLNEVSGSKPKLFRFEHFWLCNESCSDVVKEGWDVSAGHDMKGFVSRIASCGLTFENSNCTTVGNILKRVRGSRNNLSDYYVVVTLRFHIGD